MRPEVQEYLPQLNTLIRFAEGRLDGPALDEALATEEMKSLLGLFENPRYPLTTNHYRLLHKGDRTSFAGLLSSEKIINDFLKKADVNFQPAWRFFNQTAALDDAVPDYLDPPQKFLDEKIIPADDSLSDTQKKKIIKERLKEYFKYAGKPPKWIQNPAWPINADGNPLVFIGQMPIDAPKLFHDNGAAYLFFDPADGSFDVVTQFY